MEMAHLVDTEWANSTSPDDVCYRVDSKTGGGGLVEGNSWDYSTPLLLLQISTSVLITRCIISLLKPLRTPRIVAEIIAGIILGPSILGRNHFLKGQLFPAAGKTVQDVVGFLGLVYFYFMIGVQQDPMAIKAPGKKGLVIAVVGFLIPFFVCMAMARLTLKVNIRNESFYIFISLFCSTSSFPVLATVVTELQLLNSELGKIAISASMINDILSWTIRTIELAWWQVYYTPIIHLSLSLAAFLAVLGFAVRPAILWIIRRKAPGQPISEIYILTALAVAPLSGLLSDAIGLGPTFGPLIMGLIIPSGPPLGSVLIEKLDALIPGVLMPVFFTMSGLRTDISAVDDFPSSAFVLIIFIGYMGKLVWTLLPCFLYNLSLSDSLMLSLLMNTKGIVELVNINKYRTHEILDDQKFVILLLSLLFGSSIISPMVSIFYDGKSQQKNCFHRRRTVQNSDPRFGLSIAACIYQPSSVPTLINLFELSRPSKEVKLSVYPIHIIELKGRSIPLLIAHDAESTKTQLEPESESVTIVNSFQHYGQQAGGSADSGKTNLRVLPYTAIAPFSTIYQEICNIAENHRASLVIVPFHMEQTIGGTMEVTNPALRPINLSILEHAHCSVGILIDRGLGGTTGESGRHSMYRVALIFVGGADDREALAYVTWMAEHPGILVTVYRLLSIEANVGDETEGLIEGRTDDDMLSEFRSAYTGNSRVVYEEKMVVNLEGTVGLIRHLANACNLVVVGRGSGNPSSSIIEGLNAWSEFPELGAIGDMLASSEFGGTASVLVVQQYTGKRKHEYSLQKLGQDNTDGSRKDWS